MSAVYASVSKWMPKSIQDYDEIFENFINLHDKSINLTNEIAHLLSALKKDYMPSSNVENFQSNIDLKDLEKLSASLNSLIEDLSKFINQMNGINVEKLPSIIVRYKFGYWTDNLWNSKQQLSSILNFLLQEISDVCISLGRDTTIILLKYYFHMNLTILVNSYNRLIDLELQTDLNRSGSAILSNTCPYLLYTLKKITLTKLIRSYALYRAENCSFLVASDLLDLYMEDEGSPFEDEYSSYRDSSEEIYTALIKDLPISPPDKGREKPVNRTAKKSGTLTVAQSVRFKQLFSEEYPKLDELLKIVRQDIPQMLGDYQMCSADDQNGKAYQFYEEIFWGEIGTLLEHTVLWWHPIEPWSMYTSGTIQKLRDWIGRFVMATGGTELVPKGAASAFLSLADGLGVHIVVASWDRCFKEALVMGSNTELDMQNTGPAFGKVLGEMVALSNQCERTIEWIEGAPLEDLPLVEQIPILHRLDHSIHMTRLWALKESKKMANRWNIDGFFRVSSTDIMLCLKQLDCLHFADHTKAITDKKCTLDVQVQVCSLMRAKLVTEIITNWQKLTETLEQCVDILASNCRTISLANLQMFMPNNQTRYWRRTIKNPPKSDTSPYVKQYLEQILTPVLNVCENDTIPNMILEIMCTSWLDHIYVNRIVFSVNGAEQLLRDFAYVRSWLRRYPKISQLLKIRMINNDILKRCEGVGQLLLRQPGEEIKMLDSKSTDSDEESDVDFDVIGEKNQRKQTSDPAKIQSEIMPVEMYVPNQQQWLTLRARRRRRCQILLFKNPFCC